MTPAAIKIPKASGEPLQSPRSPNRKFSLYGSRRRDDDSPVPAGTYESPLPSPSYPQQQTISLPPSPKVQIVPFGFAYRDSSESLQLSQLPPLPLSPLPMSPRWDSLSHSSKFVLQPTPSSPYPASPMDPPPHPPSPFAYDAYSIPSDSRNASPTFALANKSSLGDLRASDSPSASAPPDNFNFSRPRKQSIRQPITDPATPRPTLSFNPADQYLELVSSPTQTPLWPPARPRGPSVSSCQSSSTYHSVLSPPASELHDSRQPRSRPTTNGAAPSPRLPLSNINTGGPASPNAVVAPWMSGEELRSSFRSQFTESTAPGTTATERSSVLTKDSSVTSLYPLADLEDDVLGEAEADAEDDDDELSLDDLMGMYEKGFDDDEEASDLDYHVPDRPDTSASNVDYSHTAASDIDYHTGARAPSSTSNRDYSASAHSVSLVPDHDYNIGGESRTSESGAEYDVGARPITLTSEVSHSVDARPVTSTSHRDYHDSRPPSSTSDREYHDTRPTSSSSTRDLNMGSPLTTLASDREPSHSFIQIQIDGDDDDEDFPRRGANSTEKNLDAEIRMSKMIFTSPAYINSVPHIAENLARRSMDKRELDKRDSAKSLDSEPSVVSQQRTPLSDMIPPFSPSVAEITSPISPPTSPPNDIQSPMSPPITEKASASLISPPISPPPTMAPAIAPAPPEDPSCRDRYGFKKENQYVSRQQYDTWNTGYTEYLARRRKKWIGYLKDSALMTDRPNRFPAPNAKTKRFVRKGIPPDWRGAAWFYYAGGPAILAQHSGLYDKLTTKKASEIDAEIIERDLHRTFPDNVKFKPPGGFQAASASARESRSTMTSDSVRGHSPVPPPGSEDEPPIITSLRRVLHAFSVYNPRIGYCQSLNFLAGLLLLFVETEEQCFWLLNVITRIYLPGTHETSLEGSKVDLGVLMTELRDTMPGIWDKVGGDLEAEPNSRPPTSKSIRLPRARRKDLSRLSTDRLPPITMCLTSWFMSCFIGTLPIETTLRVWDVFFYEGSKTLFRISLAVFKLGESEIKSVSDPMEMFGVVQGMPRKLIDANGLMDACFKRRNGFGHLSQDQIDVRRQERRAKAQFDRSQANKHTQTWNVSQSDTEGKAKEKSLFGKKRSPTGL
ncbi:hypothetical protein AK830_g9510 [Neonectria ditissima]|uniref:Rab-GAP TBC domain-containing protein n=1 Tax=Neonectria ditissima TaxID=78410 RepID=A0A0P7B9J7_9HYPO|nr:hypothetical protein AK830_g9510 [Neonectria ditissima]